MQCWRKCRAGERPLQEDEDGYNHRGRQVGELIGSEKRNGRSRKEHLMSIQKNPLRKGLAVTSFLGVLGFGVLIVLLHLLRPELNPIRVAVSEYAIGPYGSLMTLAFLLRGLGEACLVAGIASSPGVLRSRAGLVLLTLTTVGSFLVAIFPADRQNLITLV